MEAERDEEWELRRRLDNVILPRTVFITLFSSRKVSRKKQAWKRTWRRSSTVAGGFSNRCWFLASPGPQTSSSSWKDRLSNYSPSSNSSSAST